MLVTLLAPSDFLPPRDLGHAVVRGKLVARMKNRSRAQMRHSHLAFDHRHPRSFDTAVHREDSSCNRDAAILRRNIEMSGVALGCLDNDVATTKVDRRVTITERDGDFRALVHLHDRTIAQTQLRARSAGTADFLAFTQFCAGSE